MLASFLVSEFYGFSGPSPAVYLPPPLLNPGSSARLAVI